MGWITLATASLISGDKAVIGERSTYDSLASAYVFVRSNGVWSEQQS